MISETVTIKNKLGLHARAASVFVKTASAFATIVEVSKSQKHANGKSIMSVLSLAAPCGADLTISATGDESESAVQAIVELIKNDFGIE